MLYYGTEDKVPELLRSGGREAAALIAGAGGKVGEGLAAGLTARREDKKREEEERKAEAKLTKYARGILGVLDKGNLENEHLSGDEARGKAAGLYQRNLMDKYAAEVEADKRQAEAGKQLEGFTGMFASGLQGRLSALPAERQSHYYENPEAQEYAEGPPRPSVSESLGSALAAYPGATVSKDFDSSFGSILRAFPGAGKGDLDNLKPREGTTKAGVPYVYTPSTGQFQYVPKKAGDGVPGADPHIREVGGVKFYWDIPTGGWKPIPASRESWEDFFNKTKEGVGASGAPAAAPPPVDGVYVPGTGIVKPNMYKP